VATVLGKGVRKGDTAGRYGGEEFVLYLHMANTEQAREGARGFAGRSGRSASPTPGRRSPSPLPSVLRAPPHHGTRVEELLKHADEALYLSKQRGRDR